MPYGFKRYEKREANLKEEYHKMSYLVWSLTCNQCKCAVVFLLIDALFD
jgi:hypothetical protein